MPKYRCLHIQDKGVIRRNWDAIKMCIAPSFQNSPSAPTVLNNIFEALLCGRMQLWVVARKKDEKLDIAVVATTRIARNDMLAEKDLVVESLYGLHRIPEAEWKGALEALSEYAKKQRCRKVVTYSVMPRVLALTKQLGFKTIATVLAKEV